jgi:hypothetical protein
MILPPFGAWWRVAVGLAALQGESLYRSAVSPRAIDLPRSL